MKLGYVGLGNMGGALATRIASHHALAVFDREASAVSALAAAGATPCGSITELAETCTTILLCLPTSEHVRSALFDKDGLSSRLPVGSLVLDQTSGDPKQTRAMARELADRGIDLVDAPVSGGADAALAGTISIMLGAPAHLVGRAVDVLGLISDEVVHIGPVGTGHTMKLVNNLISTSQRVLTLEALALAVKLGIDPFVALDVLARTGARNAFLEVQARKVLANEIDWAGGFSLGLAYKDLALVCEAASQAGVPTRYGSLTMDLHRVAVDRLGRERSVEAIVEIIQAECAVGLVAAQPIIANQDNRHTTESPISGGVSEGARLA